MRKEFAPGGSKLFLIERTPLQKDVGGGGGGGGKQTILTVAFHSPLIN